MPNLPPGREVFRDAADTIRAAFPDWRSDLHALVAEGDYVAEHFTATGTHRGEFMGAAPTGRVVTLPGINLFRVRDGKIVERWGQLDVLGLMVQLGLVPEPA
jgi:predicted ester cyclase